MRIRVRTLTLLAALPARVALGAGPARADARRFDDFQDLLRARCARSHSGKVRKADLDLTTPVGLLKGGESGKVVILGRTRAHYSRRSTPGPCRRRRPTGCQPPRWT